MLVEAHEEYCKCSRELNLCRSKGLARSTDITAKSRRALRVKASRSKGLARSTDITAKSRRALAKLEAVIDFSPAATLKVQLLR
ncbi:hypothetical protein QE152_g25792 [Popillia japonica]|uniref:Uncharacterized protein n=1 Tax=Popillia japonica TaxID=7064 RepID=A0AAW1K0U5_POPJA